MFNSRISACHYQSHNSHDEKKRSSTREKEPFVETSINWTDENHKVHVTTLDVNRGKNISIQCSFPLIISMMKYKKLVRKKSEMYIEFVE